MYYTTIFFIRNKKKAKEQIPNIQYIPIIYYPTHWVQTFLAFVHIFWLNLSEGKRFYSQKWQVFLVGKRKKDTSQIKKKRKRKHILTYFLNKATNLNKKCFTSLSTIWYSSICFNVVKALFFQKWLEWTKEKELVLWIKERHSYLSFWDEYHIAVDTATNTINVSFENFLKK